MKRFQVLTDSTADLEKSVRDRFGIDYIQMTFNTGGVTYDADCDWQKLSASDFYGSMRKGTVYKTTQIKGDECEAKFKKYLDEGLDVLYVACSSKLSSSVNFASNIAKEVLADEKYQGRKIICFDTLRATAGEGLIAIMAAELAEEMGIDEAFAILDEKKLKFNEFCTVGSLVWLKKAGRVKASAAFFGNLFGVKPIIIADAKGNNYAYKKEKGRKNSLDSIVESAKERIENVSDAIVFVEHADCMKECEYVVNRIKTEIDPKEIIITNVGPIIGATVGPDTILINFYGQEVTIVGE